MKPAKTLIRTTAYLYVPLHCSTKFPVPENVRKISGKETGSDTIRGTSEPCRLQPEYRQINGYILIQHDDIADAEAFSKHRKAAPQHAEVSPALRAGVSLRGAARRSIVRSANGSISR